MPRRDRIVLIRSGRHLQVALDVLRREYPDCDVIVVATTGTDAARVQAGIDEHHWVIFDGFPKFDAWPMIRSGVAARLWARGFTRAAVLWQDPDGSDRANVDRAASVLSPLGFDAVTPDGTLIRRRTSTFVARELTSALASIATAAVLGFALYFPALVLRVARGSRRTAAR